MICPNEWVSDPDQMVRVPWRHFSLLWHPRLLEPGKRPKFTGQQPIRDGLRRFLIRKETIISSWPLLAQVGKLRPRREAGISDHTDPAMMHLSSPAPSQRVQPPSTHQPPSSPTSSQFLQSTNLSLPGWGWAELQSHNSPERSIDCSCGCWTCSR